jgi:hypothetical protein
MLKYLFEATFNDGSTITQTEADVSPNDPRKSAFFDVLNRLDDVVLFRILSSTATASVDLATGVFDVNGVTLQAQDPTRQIPADAKRRLIYFRNVRQNLHITNDGKTQSTEMSFHIGFQATVNGENVQQTIALE